MEKNRLEAFSDGVLAIIITIMVLEMKVPHGVDFAALTPMLPVFLSYVLSLFMSASTGTTTITFSRPPDASTARFCGPICICSSGCRCFPSRPGGWTKINTGSDTGYGNLWNCPPDGGAGLLDFTAQSHHLPNKAPIHCCATAVGGDWKGKISPVLYFVAIPLAFVSPWIANALYVIVALLWLIPDRRIERALAKQKD